MRYGDGECAAGEAEFDAGAAHARDDAAIGEVESFTREHAPPEDAAFEVGLGDGFAFGVGSGDELDAGVLVEAQDG